MLLRSGALGTVFQHATTLICGAAGLRLLSGLRAIRPSPRSSCIMMLRRRVFGKRRVAADRPGFLRYDVCHAQ